ncbi:winged helix-turn-helix transcriptional regulator [Phycicoccus sp. CSK15P-2]|uniref:winged helix-turn-helix domain-containing protein n=1 Tax=Phycicoccus sp. CSK15P-2 TaxID=2807627 RepID=UPI00195162DE|nr:winged helix-turn-helix domain-containing protein [Phycicoccus sp. CSK15P-2]MBM6406077.1 winged helix-turn-helix transcriptional regulator [Phycicoccus sp. CSK15P-2]
MRTPAPALLPIFRSENQARILARLLLRPQEEATLSELSRDLDISVAAVHAEVERLVSSSLLEDRRVGRNRLVRANLSSRAARALTELLTLSYGPQTVIAEEFSGLAGTDQVVAYGSWARRYRGETGQEPADVDVMVIGSPNRDEVYEAAERAERRLGIPVNPTVRSRSAWENDGDALVLTAKRDAVALLGGDERTSVSSRQDDA